MKTPEPIRLGVETFEGRVLPARLVPSALSVAYSPAAEIRVEIDRAPPRPNEFRLAAERGGRPATAFAIVEIVRPIESQARPATKPAAGVVETSSNTDVSTRGTANNVRTAAIAPLPAPDSPRFEAVAGVSNVGPRPFEILPDRSVSPVAGTTGLTTTHFYSAPADPTDARPDRVIVESGTPPLESTATALKEPSSGTLLELAVNWAIPDSLPLHGVLPLVDEFLDLQTGRWMQDIGEIGYDFFQDAPGWERCAWIAGAFLAFGGAAHAVGSRRRNRAADPAVLGTDSALAPEEWYLDPRTNG